MKATLLAVSMIIWTIREGSGRRPQVYALADLVNLCEGRRAL